jgi:PAS domain-containing protein
MDEVLAGNFASYRWQFWRPQAIRVVNWNIDRGLRLQEITDFLASQQADLLTLQEVDLNARRTHFRNVAEELARKLQMNYVFGREFEELTQGSRTSPAYHGQATLSRWRLKNADVIRFRSQSGFWLPRWFLPRTELFQERLRGRIALVTEVIETSPAAILTVKSDGRIELANEAARRLLCLDSGSASSWHIGEYFPMLADMLKSQQSGPFESLRAGGEKRCLANQALMFSVGTT